MGRLYRNASKARFSSSTFTRGSPSTPSWRPWVYRLTSDWTFATGKPRKRVPRMGVRALWFDQPALLPAAWTADAAVDAAPGGPQGLSCAGYGSLVTVTAAMGMAAAGQAIHRLVEGRYPG